MMLSIKKNNIKTKNFDIICYIFILLTFCAPTVKAENVPNEPLFPTSIEECTSLRGEYNTLIDKLHWEHARLGLGRGDQVHVGPCCARAAATRAWCKTFESHAAVWEAIHCMREAQDAAYQRCLTRLRVRKNAAKLLKRELASAGVKLLREDQQSKAVRFLNMKSGLDMLGLWVDIGNDRKSLSSGVIEGISSNSSLMMRNEFARAGLSYGMAILGVHADNLDVKYGEIERNIEKILGGNKSSTPRNHGLPPPSPVPGQTHTYLCKERLGSDPVCRQTKYSVEEIEARGGECERTSTRIECY